MPAIASILNQSMGKVRKVLFWSHLVLGVAGAIFIGILCLSGIIIAYERELTDLSEAEVARVTPPSPGSAPLDVESLLKSVQAQRPDAFLDGLVTFSSPTAASAVYLGNNIVFVNPYNGTIVGEGQNGLRAFFQWMIDFHRSLALHGDNHDIGKAVTGAASLACLSLVMTGLYIWMPRNWSLKTLKTIIFFNFKAKGKARDWNWHNVVGLWLSPLIILVTLTGVIMSYEWANRGLHWLAGAQPHEHEERGKRPEGGKGREGDNEHVGKPGENKDGQRGSGDGEEGGKLGEGRREGSGRPAGPVKIEGLNLVWERAREIAPNWQSLTARITSVNTVQFRVGIPGEGPSGHLSRLILDRSTGDIRRWEPFSQEDRGRQWRVWVRSLHTGQWAGLVGETTVVLASVGVLVLIWTGLALSYRRFFKKSSQSRKTQKAAAV